MRTDIDLAGFAGLADNVTEMGLFPALVALAVLAFTVSDGFSMMILLLLTSTLALSSVTSIIPIAYLIAYWPRFSAYSRARVVRSHAEREAIAADPWRVKPVRSNPRAPDGRFI